jgi:hypothetical protein
LALVIRVTPPIFAVFSALPDAAEPDACVAALDGGLLAPPPPDDEPPQAAALKASVAVPAAATIILIRMAVSFPRRPAARWVAVPLRLCPPQGRRRWAADSSLRRMGGSRIRQLAGLTASPQAWCRSALVVHRARMSMDLVDDPRKMALLDALYASVR